MGATARRAKPERAVRATVRGQVQEVGFRDATVARARELGVLGWVRRPVAGDDDGATVLVHAEGPAEAVERLLGFLREGPPGARVDDVAADAVRAEGHEQFAIRGVVAGRFVVKEHQARSRHWDLRLEVDGVMRSWALPKGPSLDPAAKRMAIEVPDHPLDGDEAEGPLGDGHAIVWDRGGYEQGGRVPWPEALARGHAVFVLHGEKLRGGFALQRTRADRSGRQQWLLVKRRDGDARPGSDVVAERPESVLSGRTLDELAG
ncbi:acylphosphatase [Conexibacter arvalis]|uniref:DNA ligase D-like protein (Predicted 3'-phosphoesterase) n=1 Tax=Conexibacter arvalis TaxID=912552 RepID=A0A840IFT9_9ACTN|nr:acylphosphatase [Conexibacter arvalis]MBB4662810.1 DNA ligase D-like protein (predicted 3'-phosphoesterase) [Conexibacter arvalis]